MRHHTTRPSRSSCAPPSHLVLAALVLVLLPAVSARAQNLLGNASFDDNAHLWWSFNLEGPTWSPLDASGSPSSGSLQVVDQLPVDNGGFAYAYSECAQVAGGATYHFGAQGIIPPGQTREGFLSVAVWWYESPVCAGSVLKTAFAPTLQPAAWTETAGDGVAPSQARSAKVLLELRKLGAGGSLTARFDDAFFQRLSTGCNPNPHRLCLRDGRFAVQVDWRDFDKKTGQGTGVPETDDSGLFWFFKPSNLELLVKVLDGCSQTNRYWVFAAATTNVEYTLRVTDLKHNVTKTYHNQLGVSSPAITDTKAFATCP